MDWTPLAPLLPAERQCALFPEFEEGLVDAARNKSFVHSGAFISRDQELCRSICTDLLTGISRRLIASRYSVSRNTVNAIREIMEERGELEPLKKEIAKRLDRCVIYSLENLEEAMADGKIAPGSLPIATAVLLDKKAALEGMPTARIEHVTTRKVNHDDLNAWLESLPSANPASPSDSASSELRDPHQRWHSDRLDHSYGGAGPRSSHPNSVVRGRGRR